MTSPATSYSGYLIPPEIISHALALPPVLFELPRHRRSPRSTGHHRVLRGHSAVVSEVRPCVRPDPQAPAGTSGRHVTLDELVVNIRGRQQYLWRAVDQNGDVIDILLQPRRARRAAERFFRKLFKFKGAGPCAMASDHGQASQLLGGPPHRDALCCSQHAAV